jgi:hypothetical protein
MDIIKEIEKQTGIDSKYLKKIYPIIKDLQSKDKKVNGAAFTKLILVTKQIKEAKNKEINNLMLSNCFSCQ